MVVMAAHVRGGQDRAGQDRAGQDRAGQQRGVWYDVAVCVTFLASLASSICVSTLGVPWYSATRRKRSLDSATTHHSTAQHTMM